MRHNPGLAVTRYSRPMIMFHPTKEKTTPTKVTHLTHVVLEQKFEKLDIPSTVNTLKQRVTLFNELGNIREETHELLEHLMSRYKCNLMRSTNTEDITTVDERSMRKVKQSLSKHVIARLDHFPEERMCFQKLTDEYTLDSDMVWVGKIISLHRIGEVTWISKSQKPGITDTTFQDIPRPAEDVTLEITVDTKVTNLHDFGIWIGYTVPEMWDPHGYPLEKKLWVDDSYIHVICNKSVRVYKNQQTNRVTIQVQSTGRWFGMWGLTNPLFHLSLEKRCPRYLQRGINVYISRSDFDACSSHTNAGLSPFKK